MVDFVVTSHITAPLKLTAAVAAVETYLETVVDTQVILVIQYLNEGRTFRGVVQHRNATA